MLGEHAEIAVTIIDDDFPGHLGIDEATATATVYETCGVHTFTVGRYNGASGEIQCRYELVGVTAEAGTHFAAASGTLLFRPQEMKKNVAISVVDDTTLEGKNVSLKLVLSDPLGPTKTRPVSWFVGCGRGAAVVRSCRRPAPPRPAPLTLLHPSLRSSSSTPRRLRSPSPPTRPREQPSTESPSRLT